MLPAKHRGLAIRSARLSTTIRPDLLAFLGSALSVSVLLAAAFWWVGIAGSFLAIVAVPALLIWAAVIIALRAVQAWRIRQFPSKAAYMVLTPVAVLCATPIAFVLAFWITTELLTWGTLAVKSPSYSHIIELSLKNRLPHRGTTAFQTAEDGTLFQAERQASRRIDFPLPGGFLNNWSGILYDPAGIGRRENIIQADGTDKDLFDDWWTIEKCTHMVGHFYSCGFS